MRLNPEIYLLPEICHLHLFVARATTLWRQMNKCIVYAMISCEKRKSISKIKKMKISHRNTIVLHTRPIYLNLIAHPHFQDCVVGGYFYIGLKAAFRFSFSKSVFILSFYRRLKGSVISLASDHSSVIILVLPLQFVMPEMLEGFTRDCSLYKRKINWICEPSFLSPAGISIASYRQWVREALKHTQWSQHIRSIPIIQDTLTDMLLSCSAW